MLTLALDTHALVVNLMVAVFLVVCVVLVLTVLIQRPQGGGLSGAFGAGGGAGQTAFGTKTGDALTIATILMFLLFLGFGIGLNYATRPPVAQRQAVMDAGDEQQEPEGPGDAAGDDGGMEPTPIPPAGGPLAPGSADPEPADEGVQDGAGDDAEVPGGDAGDDEPSGGAAPEAPDED